jgi:metallo-beta-lactamase family protein
MGSYDVVMRSVDGAPLDCRLHVPAGSPGEAVWRASRQMRSSSMPVNARIARLDSMSAHADAGEILRWLKGFKAPPTRTFLVHGEPPAMQALQSRITNELNWNVHTPQWLERADLQ